ncbi:carboxypeptidase-like regulatory domain-containing protein [Paenibacillus sp. strain BS8-2]
MIRRIMTGLFVLSAVAAVFLTDPSSIAIARTNDIGARLELEQSSFAVKAWRHDSSHLAAVKGRLTLGDRPVAGALLQTDSNGRSIQTGEDGTFELLVDRSLIAMKHLRVISLEGASIDSKPIGNEETASIRSISSSISIFHPIEVSKVVPSAEDASKVMVHARITSNSGDIISYFQADKYRIAGQLRDADGNPVKDAIVWIDRDQGEGFAKSTPTDKEGRYEMMYWPEAEDTNLTVIVGTRRYTLPEGKVFSLPRNTSVDIEIQLPREGLVIDDKPPYLVGTTTKGATYSGLLAGLDVPLGTSYSVTIPDELGRFVLTVHKEVWDKHPLFIEMKLKKFIEQANILKAGDELPGEYLQPKSTDPKVEYSAS